MAANKDLEQQYGRAMEEHGFLPDPENRRYGSMGLCWRHTSQQGGGFFWTYGQQDLYTIKIHDFFFHEDQLLEFHWPESLSVTWYESISGEEFSPCRRLVPGCVKSFIGGREPYRALIHRQIPIVSIGVEITPAYYRDYLRRQFPQEYQNLLESFQTLDQTEHFPEMVQLLKQVRDYRGEGLPARLFYDGKVAEAVALVAERHLKRKNRRSVSAEDMVRLADVAAFITAHCADELPLERLSRIGCMSISKLKDAFHVRYGCTITQYIQGQRTEQAGRLLRETDLPVSQGFGMSAAGAIAAGLCIAETVGKTRSDAFMAAHSAEVMGGGGLGDVSAIVAGSDIPVRTVPGIPPFGRVENADFRIPKLTLAVIGDEMRTESVLGDQESMKRIRDAAMTAMDVFIADPTYECLFSVSNRFSSESGLESPAVRRGIQRLNDIGRNAGMCMLGNSLFTDADEKEVWSVLGRGHVRTFRCSSSRKEIIARRA